MAISSTRLQWVSEMRPDAWIAQASGIPISTIGYVRRGERELPSQHYSTMRNLYQRETYRQLREEGFSYHQARRFSSYAPATVTKNVETMKDVIEKLSIGRAGGMAAKYEKLGIPYDASKLYQESGKVMKKAIQESHKSFEDIERYPMHE